MRVALVAPLFESVPPRLYGGTERVVHNLSSALTDAGIDVTVFASGDSNVPCKLVPVIDQALRLRKTTVVDPLAYSFKMLSILAERAPDFDVIHNHHDYWMLPLSKMSKTPLLSTLHGKLDLPDIPAAFQGFMDCSYVSISDSQRLPMPSLNWVKTIHHGIDLNRLSFNPNPGKYLAFLGRIDRQKRPDLAIQMAKKSGVPLKIAAKIEGPEMQAYYDAEIKPHVDGKFIEFVGEINDGEKSEFLGNALALTFPIDWAEPFGLVMIEALACGTPVLARPCGSVPEILADGITGFIHEDADVLGRKIKDISQISRHRCREWAEQKFSLKRMTEDYIDVYRQLTESRETRRHTRRAWGALSDRRNFVHTF